MDGKRILLTAFCGTSAETLVKGAELNLKFKVLYLPNDKIKDSELLIEALQQKQFDYVISLGQRPNIKDKIHIETLARKGEDVLITAFEYERLKGCLEQNGLSVKISDNAGTSYCNELYWNGLRYILEKKLDTRMVFLHVPFEKNISSLKHFVEEMKVILNFVNKS